MSRFDERLSTLKTDYLSHFEWEFDEEVSYFNSPIEKLFVAAMLSSYWARPISNHLWHNATEELLRVGIDYRLKECVGDEMERKDRLYVHMDGPALCLTQAPLKLARRQIRPDFAFFDPETETRVIVELDGHDFHERTPEQAESDKSRDRELQVLGWHAFRFTGREVLRDPKECFHEVIRLLWAKRAQRRAAMKYQEPAT